LPPACATLPETNSSASKSLRWTVLLRLSVALIFWENGPIVWRQLFGGG
jgi:hypothetical protein